MVRMDLTSCSPRRWTGCCVTWCVEHYLTITSRRPFTVVLIWLIGSLGVIVFGFLFGGVPKVETDLEMQSDGAAADRSDALGSAIQQEIERRDSLERRLQSSREYAGETDRLRKQKERWHAAWSINIMYEAVGGDIFESRVLDDIREFENRLESLPSYQTFCLDSRSNQSRCRALRSVMRFLHGTREPSLFESAPGITAYNIIPNGSQDQRNDVALVIAAMQVKKVWPTIDEPAGRLWYFDSRYPNSRLVRSTASFAKPLPGFSHVLDQPAEQEALFKEFIRKELYPLLQSASTDRVRIYFEGSDIFFQHEFMTVLIEDASKAIASLILVYIYMALYTRAPLIALFGMTTMFLSIPMGMVFFRLLGHQTMPALNFLALFLLTGIGADNLFILIDAWRQTKRDYRNLKSRLRLTFARAGKSLTACGTTTAVSFSANVFSSVRALRWFGIFVGLCVVSNLLLCLAMFPPMLLLREQIKRRKVKVDIVADVAPSTVVVVRCARTDENDDDPESTSKIDQNDHFLNEHALVATAQGKSDHAAVDAVGRRWCCCLLRRNHDNAINVSSLADIGVVQTSNQKTIRLKRGEHYYSELYAPEDETGRNVEFNCAERFFGDIYAPMLRRGCIPILIIGVIATIGNCVLVIGYAEPSRQFPQLFAPGTHNLGDAPLKRQEFGNASWVSKMEVEPLRICDACKRHENCEGRAWSAWITCNSTWIQGLDVRTRREVPHGPEANCAASYMALMSCDILRSASPIVDTGWIVTPTATTASPTVAASSVVASDSAAGESQTTHAPASAVQPYAELAPTASADTLPRGLSPNMTDSEVALVQIVFGLKVGGNDKGKIIEYDTEFNIEHPRTQVFLSRVCHTVEVKGDLLAVRRHNCLIEAFQEFLRDVKEPFPITPGYRIHGLLDRFITTRAATQRRQWQTHVGFSNGRISFMTLEIVTNLPQLMPAVDAWAWALRWDSFIESINTESERDSQHPACFHTSYLWVRAHAEQQLVSSTLLCAFASVAFASFVVFWFLGDLRLSILLICTVVSIIIALASLMFTVYGWSFGAIEAVSLIIVVGFSVDYALHIAESYNQSNAVTRYLRVQDSLRRTGGALLGAAATSVLACPPILFCTIKVFVQFGLVLIANMLLALIFSLLFFTTSLVALGPMRRSFANSVKDSVQSPKSDISVDGRSGMPSKFDAHAGCIHNETPVVYELSQPTVVSAPVRRSSRQLEQGPHLLGQDAWEKAEQPDYTSTLTVPGSTNTDSDDFLS